MKLNRKFLPILFVACVSSNALAELNVDSNLSSIENGTITNYQAGPEMKKAGADLVKAYKNGDDTTKTVILDRLLAIHGQDYGHNDWARQKYITELLVQTEDPLLIGVFYDRMTSAQRPMAHPNDADIFFRKAAVALATVSSEAKTNLYAQLQRTFLDNKFSDATTETVGKPCPVSRSGYLLIDWFRSTSTQDSPSSKDRAALLKAFVRVAVNNKYDGTGTVAGIKDPKMSKEEVISNINGLGLTVLDRMDVLASIVSDKNSSSSARKAAREKLDALKQLDEYKTIKRLIDEVGQASNPGPSFVINSGISTDLLKDGIEQSSDASSSIELKRSVSTSAALAI